MSDFLGHLVARSLELAPAVQPRLASLFEPAAGAAVPGTGFDSPATSSEDAAPSPAKRGRVGEGVLEPPQEDPSPALPRADAREREPALPSRREKPALVGVEPPPLPAPVIAPPASQAPAALPAAPAPIPPPTIRPLEAKVQEPERRPAVKPRREELPALQPLVPRIELPRLPEPRPPARAEAADPPRREAAEIRPVEPGRSPVPAPGIVVQPRIERAPSPAPPPGTPEATAPTIHVTIGRIEVRATAPQTAAAAPARRASAPAVLTLDEYLRRRDGERR